jgi:protein gp37
MKYYNKTVIDWPFKPLLTFNPMVGCKNDCSYCYAKALNRRFKWIDKWTEPQYFPERLKAPVPKKPSFIFIGSMCDLFGYWVDRQFIANVIYHADSHPEHQWIFLTKNPIRYNEFVFPDNVWLGATATNSNNKKEINQLAKWNTSLHLNCMTFISIEPLLGDWHGIYPANMNLLIVGAMTGPGAKIPSYDTVKSVDHFNIYYKKSIRDLYNIENKGMIYRL